MSEGGQELKIDQSPSMPSPLSEDSPTANELPSALSAPRNTEPPTPEAVATRKKLSSFMPASGPLRAEPPQSMCVPARRVYQYDPDVKGELTRAAKVEIKDMQLRAETCKRASMSKGEANCYFCIGVMYDNAAMLKRAVRYYKKYLALVLKDSDAPDSGPRQAIGYNAIGVNYQLLEDGWEKHAEFCHKMQMKLSSSAGRFIASTNLSLLELRRGNAKESTEDAQAALKHAITTSSIEAQAIAVAHIGVCSAIGGDTKAALSCIERYLQLSTALRDQIGQARALLNMGAVLSLADDDLGQAVSYYKEAAEMGKLVNDKTLEAKATMAQGVVQGRLEFQTRMSAMAAAMKNM